MEDKMAAAAFGHARNYGWDSPFNATNMNTQCVCLTGFQQGFIAQLVEHCTGIAEVMGANPIGASEFFLGFICN